MLRTSYKEESNNFLIEAVGFCMSPFVKNHDKIILQKVGAKDLMTGDIILYKDELTNKNTCHRLVKKIKANENILLFARADVFGIPSLPIGANNLVGRVAGIIRQGKVKNLRTGPQIILNWFIAKFYVFLRPMLIFTRNLFSGCAFKSMKNA